MSALIRWTLPLIAYLCVGTVISAAIGYGYLRRSGKLNDDTMFRIVALIQGVDLAALAKQDKRATDETPAEEPSFAEQQTKLQTATLHFDAKQRQLADSLVDFNYQLKRVSEATERYSRLRSVVEGYLKEQHEKVTDLARAKVREQLEVMDPKKQAKPLLVKMIQDGQIDEVILLLGSMKPQIRKDILRSFITFPDDIDILYQIQSHMLTDDPARPIIEAQLDQLNQLKSQDK
jgi:hypothetical protein